MQGLSSAVSQIMKKALFVFCSQRLLDIANIALMPIKQYTVFTCLLQLSAKYSFKQFYKTLLFTIHA